MRCTTIVVLPVPERPMSRIERCSASEMIRCSASSGKKGNSSFSVNVAARIDQTSERSSV